MTDKRSNYKDNYEELLQLYKKVLKENEQLEQQNKDLQNQISNLVDTKQDTAKRFKMVSVLFSNIHGFKRISEKDNADELIDLLDNFFIHFDNVVRKFNIKKISAIGDSYMCAGGIPEKNRTNPIEIIMASLEMQKHMQFLRETYNADWHLSLGIHTGPVKSRVYGKKKIAYDLKGDAVNTASRIQATSSSGKIFISEMTYEFVKEFFKCEYAGKLPVKYSGDISIYNVIGYKSRFSVNGNRYIPNNEFQIKFQLIKYDDLESEILDKLEKELPENLHYHNLKHTLDVVIQVEIIGRGEKITDEELLLLKTAALFHDIGNIKGSKDHEYNGTLMAKEYLIKYGYSDEQIETINGIIMATKLPPKPETLLQKIICDSDLDYLGRSDFIPVSDTLYKELNEQNIINNINDWNKLQIKFISNHQYFTDTAKRLREVNKQNQINRLKQLIN